MNKISHEKLSNVDFDFPLIIKKLALAWMMQNPDGEIIDVFELFIYVPKYFQPT